MVLVHLGYAMCQISPPFFGAVTHSQWIKFKKDLEKWGDFIKSKDKSRKVHNITGFTVVTGGSAFINSIYNSNGLPKTILEAKRFYSSVVVDVVVVFLCYNSI